MRSVCVCGRVGYVLVHGTVIPSLTPTYRVGQKSKLLILSEYVNKTEKLGGT